MTKLNAATVNFITLWVCRKSDGSYVDRAGHLFPNRPVEDDEFEFANTTFKFSYWEHQDKDNLDYEFWHLINEL